MNSRDAIMKALTPGDMFNQKGLVWRSVSTLTQFASCDRAEVLVALDEHFQGLVSLKPNTNHPDRGPLVALDQFIPAEPEAGGAQVQIVGGDPAISAAIKGHADEEAVAPAVNPFETHPGVAGSLGKGEVSILDVDDAGNPAEQDQEVVETPVDDGTDAAEQVQEEVEADAETVNYI